MNLISTTRLNTRLAACLLTSLLLGIGNAQAQPALPDNAKVREAYAFHIGTLAYIYGYPMVEMYKKMHNETHLVSPNQDFYAPINRFYHFDGLVTPSGKSDLRAPSAILLYFGGWCDLSKEPVIVHNPNTDGRYYTMAIADLNLELMHLGRRTIGTEEHYHALIGPDWKGALPSGVRPVQVDSNQIRVLGRLLVTDAADLSAAKKLLRQFWLAPLSQWRRGKPPPPEPKPVRTQAINPMGDLTFFRYLNQGLRGNPQPAGEVALMTQFDTIGVGPFSEFNARQLAPGVKAGLLRAIPAAREMINAASRSAITPVNGWMTADKSGRYGFDYLRRAAKLAAGGFGALPEESLYSTALFDDRGLPLSGEHRYTMTFKRGATPPVKEFWTVSAYRSEDSQFEQNAINRYHLGNLSKGLKYAPDGSLTLYFQRNAPAAESSNWLPIPTAKFFILLRQYEPRETLLKGDYRLPPIKRVD